MIEEFVQWDPEGKRTWVVLLGCRVKQFDIVIDLIHHHLPEVGLLLDFIHVMEYL